MLIDANHAGLPEQDEHDVVIVGAGATGLVLAVELARAGKKVVLLEAGDGSITVNSQRFFKTATWHGYPLEGLHVGRFRALGGTTNFWGGQIVPPPRLIFQARPWVSEARWPITADDVAPYYRPLLDLLGMSKRIDDDIDVWQRLRMPPPPATEEVEMFFSRWVPETNFAKLFERDIASNANLRVYINAPVVALVARDGDAKIGGVVVKRAANSPTITLQARQVVLASGTVEVVRLLKLPLASSRPSAWSSNRWLGSCFMDHIDCIAGAITPIDRRKFHDRFENVHLDGLKYCPKIRLTERGERQRQAVGISAQFGFNSSVQEHLTNLKIFVKSILRGRFDGSFLAYPRQLFDIARIAVPMVSRYVRYRRMYSPADQGIQMHLSAEQIPLATSRITLRAEGDELGMPLIDVTWDICGRELETMAAFAELVRDYLRANGLAQLVLDAKLEARDPEFLKDINDANHHMGGARMSATSVDGVVDADCAVHGALGLYVAGAAVFPTSGAQNPTFLAMALALRLGRHLLDADP